MDGFIAACGLAAFTLVAGVSIGTSADIEYETIQKAEQVCAINHGLKSVDYRDNVVCNNGAKFRLAELAKEQK